MNTANLRNVIAMFLVVSVATLNQINSQSKDSKDDTKNEWTYLGEIYLMFPSMSGEIGIGDIPPVSIDPNAGDIFSHLKMGAMFFFEARKGKLALDSDFLYMKLGQDLESGFVVESGDMIMKQLAWEITGLYRVLPVVEVGIGGRLVVLETELDFDRNSIGEGTIPVYKEASKTWFDPIIVTRIAKTFDEKWITQFRADIGGFGVGSQLAYQIQAYAGYRFSKLFQSTIGYRYISMDYDKDNFLYDVATYGPVIRFGFNF